MVHRRLEYIAGSTMLFCTIWDQQQMTAGVELFLRAVVTQGEEMGRLLGGGKDMTDKVKSIGRGRMVPHSLA